MRGGVLHRAGYSGDEGGAGRLHPTKRARPDLRSEGGTRPRDSTTLGPAESYNYAYLLGNAVDLVGPWELEEVVAVGPHDMPVNLWTTGPVNAGLTDMIEVTAVDPDWTFWGSVQWMVSMMFYSNLTGWHANPYPFMYYSDPHCEMLRVAGEGAWLAERYEFLAGLYVTGGEPSSEERPTDDVYLLIDFCDESRIIEIDPGSLRWKEIRIPRGRSVGEYPIVGIGVRHPYGLLCRHRVQLALFLDKDDHLRLWAGSEVLDAENPLLEVRWRSAMLLFRRFALTLGPRQVVEILYDPGDVEKWGKSDDICREIASIVPSAERRERFKEFRRLGRSGLGPVEAGELLEGREKADASRIG